MQYQAAEKLYIHPAKHARMENEPDMEMRGLQHKMEKACRDRDKEVGEKLKQEDDEWAKVEAKERRTTRKVRWVMVASQEQEEDNRTTRYRTSRTSNVGIQTVLMSHDLSSNPSPVDGLHSAGATARY